MKFVITFYGVTDDVIGTLWLKKDVKSSYQYDRILDSMHKIGSDWARSLKNCASYSVESF